MTAVDRLLIITRIGEQKFVQCPNSCCSPGAVCCYELQRFLNIRRYDNWNRSPKLKIKFWYKGILKALIHISRNNNHKLEPSLKVINSITTPPRQRKWGHTNPLCHEPFLWYYLSLWAGNCAMLWFACIQMCQSHLYFIMITYHKFHPSPF